MSLLHELRTFNSNTANLEDLIELSAAARMIETEFTVLGVELPGWFEPAVSTLRRAVKSKIADAQAARLRELKARRQTLSTIDEKRSQLDKEIAELETKATA